MVGSPGLFDTVRRKQHNPLKVAGRYLAMASRQHPFWTAVVLYLLYLALFQRSFLLSTDVWAETHSEYLDQALKHGPSVIFQTGWAGYMTLVPQLLAKLYVGLHLPLGYIDVYYQVIAVAGAVGCAALVATGFNRSLFRNDLVRYALGLGLLMLLSDRSAFSVINLWYIAMVPIILVGLNPSKLSRWQQVGYALFGAAACLTKPSLAVLPFVLYRLYRTREWLSNGLVAAAAVLQTVIMLVWDPRDSAGLATHNVWLIAKAVFVSGGVQLLKLVHVVPVHFVYIVLGNVLLAGLLVLVWRRWGLIRTLLLAFAYSFSVYAYVLAPDAPVYSSPDKYLQIYGFNVKVQREYLIYACLLLIMFAAGAWAYRWGRPRLAKAWRPLPALLAAAGIAGLLVRMYVPIDVQSAGVAANIGDFRRSLNTGQSVCVPLPPTPAYIAGASWTFEFNTICHGRHFEFTPDYTHFDISLHHPVTIHIPADPMKLPLKTVYVVVRNRTPQRPANLTLTDPHSGISFTAQIPARSKETLNFIPINTSGLPYRPSYDLALSTDSPDVYWGDFTNHHGHAFYYYLGATNPSAYRHKPGL